MENVILIGKVVIVCIVGFMIMGSIKKEDGLKSLASAFVWLFGVGIVFTLIYFASAAGFIDYTQSWQPLDILLIASFLYLVTSFIPWIRFGENKK